MSISGPDQRPIFEYLSHLEPFRELPKKVVADNRSKPVTADWRTKWLDRIKRVVGFDWQHEHHEASHGLVATLLRYRRELVKAAWPQPRLDPPATLALLEPIPFHLASMAPVFPFASQKEEREMGYVPYGFGNFHLETGWACAFKGAGHARLVSRRWFDFGPWHVLRGADDTSLVLFHDPRPETPWREAVAQAQVGHQRMGIDRRGGFLQTGFVYVHDIEGAYVRDERLFKIMVHGRDVTQSEMLEACAFRRDQKLGPDRPFDQVAFVFTEEANARAHLHELWLRELQCRAIIDGREVRLDADYHPTPQKPEWVRRLAAEVDW